MAGHWRIRHKLILGLSLVVGIIALLLGGTLKGLQSYSSTMKSIGSKIQEQIKARQLIEKMSGIDRPMAHSIRERAELDGRIGEAEEALEEYENQLQDTLKRGRDPEKGDAEKPYVLKLHEYFRELRESLDQDLANVSQEPTPLLVQRQGISPKVKKLKSASADLERVIYDSIDHRLSEARAAYRSGLIIVLSTSVLGVILMASLLGSFYRWVFYPIRDLEEGAGRVAQGDFDHRIEVHSGDEMEQLADAFNNMTGRLREMYSSLAQQVNERSRQLVRSERLASVGFLAAGVAHEINNPLASIALCSEALEHRISDIIAKKPEDREIIAKYLKMIQQEAFRCKAITERLLEFSRTGERRREPTNLADLVQSVLDVVQHLPNSKGKRIVFKPAAPLTAWVNAQDIKSVVLNLVVNALDSMDEDGKLTISLGLTDGMASLVFADTGCGMTSEILENIFEPFFTRSRTGKGTGLGLSISHRVITQHGGEIEATSPGPKRGSTFTVRLPLQPAEAVKEETLGNAAA